MNFKAILFVFFVLVVVSGAKQYPPSLSKLSQVLLNQRPHHPSWFYTTQGPTTTTESPTTELLCFGSGESCLNDDDCCSHDCRDLNGWYYCIGDGANAVHGKKRLNKRHFKRL